MDKQRSLDFYAGLICGISARQRSRFMYCEMFGLRFLEAFGLSDDEADQVCDYWMALLRERLAPMLCRSSDGTE